MNLKVICNDCKNFIAIPDVYYNLSLVREKIVYCRKCKKYVRAQLIDMGGT